MNQATTPTPRATGGLTPSRLSGGGGGGVGGGGGGSGGSVENRHPFELIKGCIVAVTAEEKNMEQSAGSFSFDVAAGGGGSSGLCAMTMATPTPSRGGGFTPLRGVGAGAITTPSASGASGGGGGGGGGGNGNVLYVRLEDSLTAFLVLALGVLRLVSPQPKDMSVRVDDCGGARVEAPNGAWIEWR